MKHIEAARGMDTVAQAYINLISLRLSQMKRPAEAQVAIKEFAGTPYANNPPLARQAANAIYSNVSGLSEPDRLAMLGHAEALFKRVLANAPKRSEMSALCKFELAIVLGMEARHEEADPLFKDSVIETNDASTKELRNKRRIETLKQLKRFDEAREVLNLLIKTPRADIEAWVRAELRNLDATKPGTK